MSVNSREYWERRFQTNWDMNHGREQTRFFGNLMVNHLPDWLMDELANTDYTICDLGCAEGDSVPLFAQAFHNQNVTGIDFSKEAIEKAKESYPEHRFECGDMNELTEQFDVIITSNTLEHFENPFSIMRKLTQNAKQHLIVMVPFQEQNRIEEHFFTFDYNNFPLVIESKMLSFSKVIDSSIIEGTQWRGKQILVVYSDPQSLQNINVKLSAIYGMFEEQSATLEQLKMEFERLRSEKDGLNVEFEGLRSENTRLQGVFETISHEKEELLQVNEEQILKLNEALLEHSKLNEALMEQRDLNRGFNQRIEELIRESAHKGSRADYLANTLNDIYSSDFWKFARMYYKLRDRTPIKFLYKSVKTFKNDGFSAVVKKTKNRLAAKKIKTAGLREFNTLEEVLAYHKDKPVVIFPALVDWNIPLFQRPQHIASNISKQGYLYLFGTWGVYDKVQNYLEIADGCIVTPHTETDALEKLLQTDREVILHLYSTDNMRGYDYVNRAVNLAGIHCKLKVLYEFVDEIHEEISGMKISENVLNRHKLILENEDIYVVSTAQKLYEEVSEKRSENHALITNGVDYNHFRNTSKDIPSEIEHIVRSGKPVIGYFGAFAKWFDYALVEKLAKAKPDYEILLIGWNYDGSLDKSALNDLDNVHIIGPINYNVLPEYSKFFDVSTIPFVINDITESTSPIKLFEYMAMGHPIVTTGMPECRKYKSVLIGENHDDFIEKIDKALKLRKDPTYLKLINDEAMANTWAAKANDIIKLISNE